MLGFHEAAIASPTYDLTQEPLEDIMENEAHALISASGSPGWIACYAYLAQRATQPDTSSPAARKGTAGHDVASQVLTARLTGGNRLSCYDFVGECIAVEGDLIEITEGFAQELEGYVDYVWGLYKSDPDAVLLIETKVNYAAYLGVPKDKAWGTSDAILVLPSLRRVKVIDLKTGHGGVAADTPQNKLYGLGSLAEVELAFEVDEVELTIYQSPFDEPVSEHLMSIPDLKMWARTTAAMAAQHGLRNYALAQEHGVSAIALDEFTPGDKQCQWCASGTCPKTTQMVADIVANGFVDLDAPQAGTVAKTLSAMGDTSILTPVEVAEKMKWLAFIENWIKSVRAAAESKLLAGEPVPGYKLVRGKMGSRQWQDQEQAAKVLQRNFGAAEAFKKEPISPAQAEKVVKRLKPTKQDQERVMKTLSKYWTQKEGGISVAPDSDPRQPYSVPNAAEAFTNLEGEAGDLSHLA